MREIAGFEALQVVQTSETEVVLLIFGDTVAVLDRVATEVGSRWMGANVVPLLAARATHRTGHSVLRLGVRLLPAKLAWSDGSTLSPPRWSEEVNRA